MGRSRGPLLATTEGHSHDSRMTQPVVPLAAAALAAALFIGMDVAVKSLADLPPVLPLVT